MQKKKYSVLQNVWYCLINTRKCCFALILWCAAEMVIQAVLPIAAAYLPKAVIEKITLQEGLPELAIMILVFMAGIAVLSGGGKFFERYIFHQKYQMNTFYLKHVALKGLTTDYTNQEDSDFRKLQHESFSCCNGNYSPLTAVYDILISLGTGVLGASVFWAMLAQLNWMLIVFLIGTTAAGFLVNQKIIRWTDENNSERMGYEQRLDYINQVSGDIRSAKETRLYRMALWFSDIYRENMSGIAGWYRRLMKEIFGAAAGESTFSLLRESAAYIYLIYLVWNGQITVADFVFYIGVVTGFSEWLGSIFSELSKLNQISLKINYFRSYLEYPEVFRRTGGKEIPADRLPKIIELKNVSYWYTGSDRSALHNVSLTITPGEHLAIVGVNGAGKTTLVKLICGLIDPTEGQVLYDGIDIRAYDRTEFYRLFSAVFQRFSILPVSIEEIVAETPEGTLDSERVKYCLQAAGLWEKTEHLPKGVKTQFGKIIYDDGAEFSGGEVQKLLLARALYKGAPVMLLDEPTAALDPISESSLYENYHRISESKTTVFISHRLASTSFCSRILLIENGEICEEGTHDSLLRRRGKYFQLFETQAKYYRKKAGEGTK